MGSIEGRSIMSKTGDAAKRRASKHMPMHLPRTDSPKGLYDPLNDHDSCGVGFIVNLRNRKSNKIIVDGLRLLENLEHRGAVGADPLMGDGAGILTQIPHAMFAAEADRLGFTLPAPGEYAIGVLFLPQDAIKRGQMETIVSDVIER